MIKLSKYRIVKYTQKNGVEVFYLQRRSAMLVFWNTVGYPEHCLEHAKERFERVLKEDLEAKERKFIKEEIIKF